MTLHYWYGADDALCGAHPWADGMTCVAGEVDCAACLVAMDGNLEATGVREPSERESEAVAKLNRREARRLRLIAHIFPRLLLRADE